jgi:FkbM family methyltransferase
MYFIKLKALNLLRVSMVEKIISAYVLLFGKSFFYKFNKFLYRLSLGGLGILNYKNSRISGEKSFLEKYFRKNQGILVDVGANQGDYSLEAIGICPSLKIFAFEPHPITFSSLSKRLNNHHNIIAVNKGMSSESGVYRLYDYSSRDGSSHASLFRDVITEIHGAGSAVSHEVELTTLDQFMDSEGIKEIDLLKIDTEGNELQVLRGGGVAISEGRIRAIHFEFNEMNVSSRAYFRDFWKLLDRYRFYRLLPNEMLEIKQYSPLQCEIFAYQNIVAILKD